MAGHERSRRNTAAVLVTSVAILVLVTACAGAAGPNNVADVDTNHISGFWAGLWQGFIMPVTFIVSLFTDSVNIYDVHNNGAWYNFGFVLGALLIFGGGGKGAPRRRK